MIEALYIHVPFCAKRCSYCDFASEACADGARMDVYCDALSLQLRRAAKAGLLGQLKTIYIGGGTPSYLGMRRLNSLVYLISLFVNLENVEEFTIEANPDSIDARMVKDLFALGVNRFSIGAQSFDDAVLNAYGRIHTAEQVKQACTCVRERTENFSLDLICGGPQQDKGSWEQSVKAAIELGAAHVSVYPLMLEEETPLQRAVSSGGVRVPDDDAVADMMLSAEGLFAAAGLERYEVASYARPGYECKHNLAYWSGVEYLGLGAAASSMLAPGVYAAAHEAGVFLPGASASGCAHPARIRFAASCDTDAFIASQGRAEGELEMLDAREAVLEDLMLAMRRAKGASCDDVRSAQMLEPRISHTFEKLFEQGLVYEEDGRFAPTQRGWLCGNEIFGAIWSLAE